MSSATAQLLLQEARAVEDHVIQDRNELYSMPELRFAENRTIACISQKIGECIATMRRKNMACTPTLLQEKEGGIWLDLDFKDKTARRLFRADVDAVAIEEAPGGVMHACGHDAHAAMLLGFLRVLANGWIRPTANLRLVWQRAEENPGTTSGGKLLCEEGVLNEIESVHALHIRGLSPAGSFQVTPGRAMANSGRFLIRIGCDGGHVMAPHRSTSAADVLADVVVALRRFPLHKLGPFEPCSIVPAYTNAGSPDASNVMPASASAWFSCRTFLDPKSVLDLKIDLRAFIEDVIGQYPNARLAEFTFHEGHPMLHNTPEITAQVARLLEGVGMTVEEVDPILGGEDFAWYLQQRPGSFVFLGAHQEGSGANHSPAFNPDPSVFWMGVLYWLLIATM